MSWRSGSKLFAEIWPLLESQIPSQEMRIEVASDLLKSFVRHDMDAFDVEDLHPEVRAAMRMAGIGVSEPERYVDDHLTILASGAKRFWWQWW